MTSDNFLFITFIFVSMKLIEITFDTFTPLRNVHKVK